MILAIVVQPSLGQRASCLSCDSRVPINRDSFRAKEMPRRLPWPDLVERDGSEAGQTFENFGVGAELIVAIGRVHEARILFGDPDIFWVDRPVPAADSITPNQEVVSGLVGSRLARLGIHEADQARITGRVGRFGDVHVLQEQLLPEAAAAAVHGFFQRLSFQGAEPRARLQSMKMLFWARLSWPPWEKMVAKLPFPGCPQRRKTFPNTVSPPSPSSK